MRFVPVLSFRTGKDGGQRLREALHASERYSGLVLTSQQAVQVLAVGASPLCEVRAVHSPTPAGALRQAIKDCSPTPEALHRWVIEGKRLFCVGPQTSDKLANLFSSTRQVAYVAWWRDWW